MVLPVSRPVGSVVLALLLIAGGLLAPAWFELAGHPEHEVRTAPLRMHTGRLSSAAPVGQRFLCEGSGLHRIDVALVVLKRPGTALELVLREGDPRGRILRRVAALPHGRRAQEYLSFEFDPIAESAGLWIHFQLAPADGEPFAGHAAWLRFHGQVGRDSGPGYQVLEEKSVEAGFNSPLDGLRAIAVVGKDLSTERGEIRLELWRRGPWKEPLRVAQLPAPTEVRAGHAFFSFPSISGSAGEHYWFRVTSEGPARFIARLGVPSFKTLHGVPGSRPGMGGMTTGELLLPDRDLVFRAWSDDSAAHGLSRVAQRAGWRLWAAVLCWTLTVLALVRLLACRGSARSPETASS